MLRARRFRLPRARPREPQHARDFPRDAQLPPPRPRPARRRRHSPDRLRQTLPPLRASPPRGRVRGTLRGVRRLRGLHDPVRRLPRVDPRAVPPPRRPRRAPRGYLPPGRRVRHQRRRRHAPGIRRQPRRIRRHPRRRKPRPRAKMRAPRGGTRGRVRVRRMSLSRRVGTRKRRRVRRRRRRRSAIARVSVLPRGKRAGRSRHRRLGTRAGVPPRETDGRGDVLPPVVFAERVHAARVRGEVPGDAGRGGTREDNRRSGSGRARTWTQPPTRPRAAKRPRAR